MKDLTPEEIQNIESFNEKAYNRLLEKGVDKAVLHDIFLSGKIKDFYFTAKEAEKIGLVDKVTEVKRNKGIPTISRVAAKIKSNAKIKYELYKQKQMSLFGKKEPIVTRAEVLGDDRIIVFSSVKEALAKGDKIALVGSNDSLKGRLVLNNKMIAVVGEDNVVEAIEEPTSNEMDGELMIKIDEIVEAITSLMARVDKLEGGGEEAAEANLEASGHEDDEDEEAKKEAAKKQAEEVEAAQAEMTELTAKLAAMKTAISKNTLASKFVIGKREDKQEAMNLTKLSASAEHAISLKQVLLNGKIKDKIVV